MLKRLEFPKVTGGRVTDCIFSPEGSIEEIWIVLDTDSQAVEFIESFKVPYSARVHMNTRTATGGEQK